jgi:hypothetical protein
MIKKKPKEEFKFNEDVELRISNLSTLKAKFNDTYAKMSADFASINIKMPMEDLMRKLQGLPLDDLHDLYDLEKGQRLNLTKLTELRDKVIKVNRKREVELSKLKAQIELAEIDLTLAKIKFLTTKLDV